MKNKTPMQYCQNCCWYTLPVETEMKHFWWCKERDIKDLLQDIAKRLDSVAEHFN